jgi:hypothetical protein
MTYCVGWIVGDTGFLASDSAVTGSRRPRLTHSSFAELHEKVRGEFVSEGALKIIRISDDAAVAFSGHSDLIEKVGRFLTENYSICGGVESVLRSMVVSIGPFPKKLHTCLLAVSSSAEGGAQLYRWDSWYPSTFECGESFYWIGNVHAHARYTPQVLRVIEDGMQGTWSPEADVPMRLLTCVTSLIQSYGIRNPMMQSNIGGAIAGLLSRGGQALWQRDTGIVVHDHALENNIIVRLMPIGDGLVVKSSANNAVQVFMISEDDRARVVGDKTAILEQLRRDPEQWVLLDSGTWRIAIVDGRPGTAVPAGSVVKFAADGESVELSHQLVNSPGWLFQPATLHPYFIFCP